jgi:hypothetical protein
MPSLDAVGVAQGVKELFEKLPSRSETRAYAEQFSWAPTTEGQFNLFNTIVAGRRESRI